MLANLLDSLQLPAASRIAVQVDKSVEALMLYLATLRAGHIFVPLNTAYQSGEMAYFLQDAQAAVLVCSSANLPWLQPLADAAGTQARIHPERQPHRHPAGRGSAPQPQAHGGPG